MIDVGIYIVKALYSRVQKNSICIKKKNERKNIFNLIKMCKNNLFDIRI